MKIKNTICAILVLVIVMGMVGCSSGDKESSSSKKEENSHSVFNPITGEEGYDPSAVNLRPMAVVMSNIKTANPQDGATSADMIYESLAEGGITRMLAVFPNYKKMPQVGPIRSARIYFVKFAMGMDAQYVHFGGSTTAKELIATEKLEDKTIDGGYFSTTAFNLDKKLMAQRGGQEHAYFTSGELIENAIKSKKTNMNTEDGKAYAPFFRFCYYNRIPSGIGAKQVQVRFSAYNTSHFIYDESSGLYKKFQWNQPQVERVSGEQISVKNVFVIYAKMWNHGKTILMDADLSTGEGYYMSNGSAQQITWKKGNTSDPLRFYDKDGKELIVNSGKSYVCMVPDYEKDNCVISDTVTEKFAK